MPSSTVFKELPADVFNKIQTDAGVLVKGFNVATPAITDDMIITATTGGHHIAVTPQYNDYGADIDNCPENTKELKRINTINVEFSTTAITVSAKTIKLALGAADGDINDYYFKTKDTAVIDGKTYYTRSGSTYTEVDDPEDEGIDDYYEHSDDGSGTITPRLTMNVGEDFSDIWWIGRTTNEGWKIACKCINALATNGLDIQTGKHSKGQMKLTFTGHYSIYSPQTVPFVAYVIEPSGTADLPTNYAG